MVNFCWGEVFGEMVDLSGVWQASRIVEQIKSWSERADAVGVRPGLSLGQLRRVWSTKESQLTKGDRQDKAHI